VKYYWAALQFASEALKRDKEIVLEAIRTNTRAFKCASEELKSDPDFLRIAFEMSFHIYESVPEIRSMITSEYSSLINELEGLNINFPMRFKLTATAREIIKNRKSLNSADSRPLAVIIYPTKDENNAFETNNINDMINGYRVVYFEAENENQVYEAIKISTRVQKASLLVLAGHGVRTHVALGANNPAITHVVFEKYYIDLSDEEEIKKQGLSDSIENNAAIVLESCSTGEGKEKYDNVANLMKRLFPQARIFAPTDPTRVSRLELDRQGKLVKAKFTSEKTLGSPIDCTYQIK
jgi:hypothetical protein